MAQNYVLLETIALTQSAASVTFDNLPTSGYTDLKIVMSANCTGSGASADDIRIRFNGNTSASYSMRSINGSGSAASSASESGQTSSWCGNVGGTGSIYNNAEIYIPNYLSTSNAKSTSVDNVVEANATAAPMRLIAQLWNPGTQAAITSILLYPSTFSWSAGSTFSLYGIAAFGTTPVLAPKATGGNSIENDGTYWIHTFTSSGTFTPQVALTCEYLVIAGGGGGGYGYGAGGGAGGYRTSVSGALTGGGGSAETPLSLASGTSIPVTIGAGGPSRVAIGGLTAGFGGSGSNSIFSTVTSTGGGGGGFVGNVGLTGGSGGGGGGTGGKPDAAGGARTASPVQGFNGGSANDNGGGGGGAGAIGVFATQNGGAGLSNSITGVAVNRGGGGGGNISTSQGGIGGGGAVDVSGTANTGGGGGSQNGNGGSGIILIRYPIA